MIPVFHCNKQATNFVLEKFEPKNSENQNEQANKSNLENYIFHFCNA